MAKVGRPTLYKPEYCQMLIDHLSQGRAYLAFAGKLSVTADTLYEWERVHPEFSEAKKIGTQKGFYFWDNLGIDMATGLVDNKGFPAWMVNMRNKFGWRSQDAAMDFDRLIASLKVLPENEREELENNLSKQIRDVN